MKTFVTLLLIFICFSSYSEEGFGWSNIFALVDQEIGISTDLSLFNSNDALKVRSNQLTGSISIYLNLPENSIPVFLRIYSVHGKCVKEYIISQNGIANIVWNGKGEKGKDIAAGVYYIQLEMKNCSVTEKIFFLR